MHGKEGMGVWEAMKQKPTMHLFPKSANVTL